MCKLTVIFAHREMFVADRSSRHLSQSSLHRGNTAQILGVLFSFVCLLCCCYWLLLEAPSTFLTLQAKQVHKYSLYFHFVCYNLTERVRVLSMVYWAVFLSQCDTLTQCDHHSTVPGKTVAPDHWPVADAGLQLLQQQWPLESRDSDRHNQEMARKTPLVISYSWC